MARFYKCYVGSVIHKLKISVVESLLHVQDRLAIQQILTKWATSFLNNQRLDVA